MAMKYSFLLVNFNMAGLIKQLVRNIALQISNETLYEILIADNSSEEVGALASWSAPEGIPVSVLRIPNLGFVNALNHLIPLVTGQYVMIMHPDVELKPGCLHALTTFLENHPKAAVVGPDLYYPDGSPNKIRLRFPTIATEGKRVLNIPLAIITGKRRLGDEVLWDRQSDVQTQTVMGVCMLVRGDVLRQIHEIDPGLVFYYANDYLCWRVQELGWTCHYTLSANAIHFERYTPRELYTDSGVMEYKRSPIAANPRMRADYFQFTSHRYQLGARVLVRGFALIEDGIQLVAQFKHPRDRRSDIRKLSHSVLVDLGRSMK